MSYTVRRKDPCPCGSTRKAKYCCLTGPDTLHKASANILPPSPRTQYAHPRCYAALLHDCSPGVSKEHFISRGLLQQIGLNGTTKIAGLRWQEPETFKILPDERLAPQVLCGRHNIALSSLDAQMIRFSDALERFDDEVRDETDPAQGIALFAGYDIERWLLKAIVGGVVSRNMSGVMPDRCVELLYGISSWPDGTGLYFRATTGQTIYHSDSFRLETVIAQPTSEVVLFDFVVRGLPLRLVLTEGAAALPNGTYRPRRLIFSKGSHTRTLEMSWDDPRLDATIPLYRQPSYTGSPPDWPIWARQD